MILTPINSTESAVHLSGYVTGTTGIKDVWPIASTIDLFDILRQVSVSSSDTTDVSTNDGAHQVIVEGLDSNWDIAQEAVLTNGQTAAITVSPFYAVNGISIIDAGVDGTNKGVIYAGSGVVSSGVPATKYSVIDQAKGISQVINFTVPRNHTLEIESVTLMPKTVGVTSFEWRIERNRIVETQTVSQTIVNLVYRDPAQSYTEFKRPIVFNPRENFMMQVAGLNTGGDIVVDVVGKLKVIDPNDT